MCKIDDSLNNAVETLKSVCAQKVTNNEFSIFGQHIAAQLEKLPVQQALLLQEKIQSLITNARLEIISRPSTSCTGFSSDDLVEYHIVNQNENDDVDDAISPPLLAYTSDNSLFYNNLKNN